MKMNTTYNPHDFEERIYREWLDKKYFEAKIDKKKEPFTIVIPPPNITGQLHMGHALNNTIQDSIIRYKRMKGFSTLWLPGTDHASIATEVKIVEKMKSEGLTKDDVGRDGFLERAWDWKKQYGGRIVEQLKRLGSSCDWSREAFTMDENCSKAVKHVFVKLYNKGLIYKGDRIINWCPSCATALSDAEVEYEEKDSFLWHVRYPFADGSGEIIIATTRPETILGDTAVAVNPKDERYTAFIGKMLKLPLTDKEIPLIADNYVEKDFGSGAVKITPAHDPNDFEVGARHNLEVIRIMNDDGTMNELAGKYVGMDRLVAREAIVNDLKEQGLLVKIEPYKHNVGECYRCKSIVEPIVSKQWFVKMAPLAKPAIDAVKRKKIEFLPENFVKTYYNWMKNIKDWCISRQLWWGHRIPAYYCKDCGNMMVLEETPHVCDKCCGNHITQDDAVLDTWFSSALWPFSTLGYPDKTADLDYFYPTSLLVTAYDIIFFWVARMIFSGIEHMGEVPFPEVLFHGIVRDSQGRKMSKSLGNGIDPLEIIDEYGADSLRLSLLMGISVGGDTRFYEEKVIGCRNFLNKVWNASRFVIMNSEGVKLKELGTFRLMPADKWILSKLNELVKFVTKAMDKYDLGMASTKVHEFIWTDFCDWYIELSKTALNSGNQLKKENTVSVLNYVLRTVLKLLHPFAPFITEEIYKNLKGAKGAITVSTFPDYNKKFNYTQERKYMEKIMDLIKSIRNIKAEVNAPFKRINLYAFSDEAFKAHSVYVSKMCNIENITYIADKSEIAERVSGVVTELGEFMIPLGDLVDFEKELERLKGEYDKTIAEIKRAEGMLANERFTAKAPKNLVDAERDKLEKYKALALKLKAKMDECAIK